MAAPIPNWYNPDGSQCLSWDAGIVDADSRSAIKEVYVWNNKGGASTVADMTNVFLTTKNTDGTDTGPIATKTDAIVELSTYDGATWSAFQEVGGSLSTVQLINGSGEVATIRGASNDGNPNTEITKKNFARIQLRLHVLPTAPAGPVSWKTRVSYQYTS